MRKITHREHFPLNLGVRPFSTSFEMKMGDQLPCRGLLVRQEEEEEGASADGGSLGQSRASTTLRGQCRPCPLAEARVCVRV